MNHKRLVRTGTATTARPHIEPLEDRTLLATCHVSRLSDAGAGFGFRGDLRYCINRVNANPGADVIDFHVTGVIQLSGALPDLSSDVDILGPGADALTVRRNTGGDYRIFSIDAGVTVEISGLTITNGRGGIFNDGGTLTLSGMIVTENLGPLEGGGIHNNHGEVTIVDSSITANRAGHGGGIYNLSGTVNILSSTISGNRASGVSALHTGGGGIGNDLGIVTIENSTVADNLACCQAAALNGGGIDNNEGTVTVSHSTIADNNAQADGGGIMTSYPNSFLHIGNSIVALNGASQGTNIKGAPVSNGYNLFGSSDYIYTWAPTDLLDVDPQLGPLADNGGPTQTFALLSGSPAIDTGTNQMAPEWDQRGPGFPRIVNGTIDRGAFEVQTTSAPTGPIARRGSPDPAVLITAKIDDDD